jgi:hypothetical protein
MRSTSFKHKGKLYPYSIRLDVNKVAKLRSLKIDLAETIRAVLNTIIEDERCAICGTPLKIKGRTRLELPDVNL